MQNLMKRAVTVALAGIVGFTSFTFAGDTTVQAATDGTISTVISTSSSSTSILDRDTDVLETNKDAYALITSAAQNPTYTTSIQEDDAKTSLWNYSYGAKYATSEDYDFYDYYTTDLSDVSKKTYLVKATKENFDWQVKRSDGTVDYYAVLTNKVTSKHDYARVASDGDITLQSHTTTTVSVPYYTQSQVDNGATTSTGTVNVTVTTQTRNYYRFNDGYGIALKDYNNADLYLLEYTAYTNTATGVTSETMNTALGEQAGSAEEVASNKNRIASTVYVPTGQTSYLNISLISGDQGISKVKSSKKKKIKAKLCKKFASSYSTTSTLGKDGKATAYYDESAGLYYYVQSDGSLVYLTDLKSVDGSNVTRTYRYTFTNTDGESKKTRYVAVDAAGNLYGVNGFYTTPNDQKYQDVYNQTGSYPEIVGWYYYYGASSAYYTRVNYTNQDGDEDFYVKFSSYVSSIYQASSGDSKDVYIKITPKKSGTSKVSFVITKAD